MIGEIKEQRNEEWYVDEHSKAIRKQIAVRQTLINSDMRGTQNFPEFLKKCI
jgi:hypothetical protein